MGFWNRIAGMVPKHPEAKREGRYDFFENSFLGYGTSRDKLAFGGFSLAGNLTDNELDALYYHDDAGAKIVNAAPEGMLTRGYQLVSKKNPTRAADLQKQGEALDIDTHFLRGMQWGRLRGGAAIVVGALDGSDNLATPLREKSITGVKYLNTVDRRSATVYAYQENPLVPGYGEPEIYSVGSDTAGATRVHASRLIRFDGVPETDRVMRKKLGGWTQSALQRPYEVLRAFAMSYKSVEHLIADASQGVWKIQGLIDLLTADEAALMTRIRFADMTRSAGRAIMVDADNESFDRVPTSFAGLKDVIELQIARLASAGEIPQTLLMGRSPAGMNATGESDFRAWYDHLANRQMKDLKQPILRAYRIIGGATTPDDLDVEFNPLWAPSKKEQAETDKIVADTDKIYFDMGAVLSGQVAIARFGSGEGKIEIDEDAVRAELDHDIELMKDPEKRAEQEALVAQAAQAKAPKPGEDDAEEDEEQSGEKG